MPFHRNKATANTDSTPLHSLSTVKYQPLPAASNSGYSTAIPVAAIAQRVMLVAADAVLRLRGKESTNNVLKVVYPYVPQKPCKN
jgi:hypothetical protein